ncbi:MAG: ABC transporter permease [Anaerolineales bacterium]|jgi:ABC-2 type transport system permease protein
MIAYLIRTFSFFMKEIHDVRRQPRLMLSLVGGPLLVLAAFGATFRSANPFVSMVLVWPESGIPGFSQEQAEKFLSSNFYLVEITTDEDEAMQMLDRGEVDVVQVIPEVIIDQVAAQVRPEIQIISNTVDPSAEAWIRSLSYGEMNYINKQLLSQQAILAQDKAEDVNRSLLTMQDEFEALSQNFDADSIDRAKDMIAELRPILADLEYYLPPETQAQANLSPELSKLHSDIEILIDDLDELEQVLDQGDLVTHLDRLNSVNDEIGDLQGSVDVFITTPTENIISPVRETYTNLRGGAYSMVVFYAPAVLALLVQQLAITLASLGLVRERQMGSFEMFRVSPLKFSQIIVGKSLAYILYVSIAGVILTFLLSLIQVPMPYNLGQYMALLVLLATASVGIGFLISATSRTDSQAIQLTMLVLLLSIFFTGFFLPITGFNWPAWIIALLIPMTHAITGFQDLILAGQNLGSDVWIGLVIIILLSYGLVSLIMRRQYRKVLD